MNRPAPAALLAVLVLSMAPRLAAQAADRGKVIYDKWCAGCHGENGAGDGEGAAFMLPRPRDFTRALFQVRTTASGELPTDRDLEHVIDEGMPGTAMPAWKSRLGPSDRDAVIAYIKTFSRFFQNAAPQALSFGKPPSGGSDAIEDGRQTYQTIECFKCHGQAGRGDGPSAPTLSDDWDAPIRAADLTQPWRFNGGGTVENIYQRLRTGLDGTPMPSFGDIIDAGLITDEQLWHVAQYVRSLGPEDAEPPVRDVIRAALVPGDVPTTPDDSVWQAIEPGWIPLVGQVIKKPRWFAPRVSGLWVQAAHNGERLSVRLSWDDPSRSPDPGWQQWLDAMARTMTDVDGPVPITQGPDRVHVQFPLRPTEGMERPYFLGGDAQHPVYQWQWSSQPDQALDGIVRGLGTFQPQGGNADLTHAARFDAGQWQVVLTRSLTPSDTTAAPSFVPGGSLPIAFFAADGSDGEREIRGAVSAWYQIYLDVPTPTRAYVTPVLAMLLTAGLGVMLVWRAQQRDRHDRMT